MSGFFSVIHLVYSVKYRGPELQTFLSLPICDLGSDFNFKLEDSLLIDVANVVKFVLKLQGPSCQPMNQYSSVPPSSS